MCNHQNLEMQNYALTSRSNQGKDWRVQLHENKIKTFAWQKNKVSMNKVKINDKVDNIGNLYHASKINRKKDYLTHRRMSW